MFWVWAKIFKASCINHHWSLTRTTPNKPQGPTRPSMDPSPTRITQNGHGMEQMKWNGMEWNGMEWKDQFFSVMKLIIRYVLKFLREPRTRSFLSIGTSCLVTIFAFNC